MLDKRGLWLLESSGKIIIAIICIGILIFLGMEVYKIFNNSLDLEKAQIQLGNINNSIKELKSGESKDYVLLNPGDWILVGWPNDNFYDKTMGTFVIKTKYDESQIPDICIINNWQNCLCICKYSFSVYPHMLETCNDNKLSSCIEVDRKIIVNEDGSEERKFVDITGGKNLKISLFGDKLKIVGK